MQKRYRVFISSTTDLEEERDIAIKAVQACDCIPIVMEVWPAKTTQLTDHIRREINLCDFFVLLVGKRYGSRASDDETASESMDASRMETGFSSPGSFVELEYDAAVRQLDRTSILVLMTDKGVNEDTADAACQRKFRAKLQKRHTVKSWRDETHLTRTIVSSLMHEILERESAQVVESNADLVAAVKSFVDEQKNCKINITRAIFVQFSGANAKEILKKLIWSEIDTELYVAQRKIAAAVNSWQERQVNTLTPDYLRNYLEPMNTSTKLGSLTLNSYDVNGSLRALMLEVEDFDADGRLVGSKPGWVAIGCYNYMTRWPLADEIVDIRGGELPMAIFRKEHSGCQLMASMVHAVVSNWNQFGKVATVQVLPKQNAATV